MLEDIFGVFREVYEKISGNKKEIEQINVKLETIEEKVENHGHGTNAPPKGIKTKLNGIMTSDCIIYVRCLDLNCDLDFLSN